MAIKKKRTGASKIRLLQIKIPSKKEKYIEQYKCLFFKVEKNFLDKNYGEIQRDKETDKGKGEIKKLKETDRE